MLTFGQLVASALLFDDQASSDFADLTYDVLVREAVHSTWDNHAKPIHEAPFAARGYQPYSTGTVTLTSGSTAVSLAGGTWDYANWTTPALLVANNANPSFLVNSFDSATTLTLDQPWIADSASAQSYTIFFPTINLPTDFGTQYLGPSQGWIWGQCKPLSYPQWLQLVIIQGWVGGIPQAYAFSGGDGVSAMKMHLWPPPYQDVYFRGTYTRKTARGLRYHLGGATVTNSDDDFTGTSTLWQQTGWTITGSVAALEFPKISHAFNCAGTIDTISSNTAGKFAAVWNGPTLTAQPYCISEILRLPDSAMEPLQATIRRLVAERRGDGNMAAAAAGLERAAWTRYDSAMRQFEGPIPWVGITGPARVNEVPYVVPRVIVIGS